MFRMSELFVTKLSKEILLSSDMLMIFMQKEMGRGDNSKEMAIEGLNIMMYIRMK